jgi:dimethylamine monooxygenase subunit A
MTVGARPLGSERLIEVDHTRYHAELAQKRAILGDDLRYYVQSLPGSEPAEWEALAAILTALARDEPECFSLTKGAVWEWQNRLTGELCRFRYGQREDLPTSPLDWAGRQVQEDLLLMGGDADVGFPLIAGQLCFANRWCLDDKIGQPYLAIHAPVPGFAERVGRSSSMLLDRLKQDRPVWRLNWSILATGELNRATRFGHELDGDRAGVTLYNAGERCFFRTERQTLSRMPISGTILFTVHTYIAPIAQLAEDDQWRAKMIGVLRTTPPEMLAYKGMAIFSAALLAYLEQYGTLERAV